MEVTGKSSSTQRILLRVITQTRPTLFPGSFFAIRFFVIAQLSFAQRRWELADVEVEGPVVVLGWLLLPLPSESVEAAGK